MPPMPAQSAEPGSIFPRLVSGCPVAREQSGCSLAKTNSIIYITVSSGTSSDSHRSGFLFIADWFPIYLVAKRINCRVDSIRGEFHARARAISTYISVSA